MQVIFYFILHKDDYNILISIRILKLYHFIFIKSDILIFINENIRIEKKLFDSELRII